jgi:hypothetical protein
MENNQASSTNIIDNNIQGYNICAGKGCNNIGRYRLSIIYINKTGLFCDTCKKELEECGLISTSRLINNNFCEVKKSD